MGMLQKPFGDLITFTRLGAAGYWNWQAVYTMAAANEPRINHDPATLSISETSVTLGAGEHTFATNYLYVVGTVLRASADADNWMTGRVIAASEGSVTIAVTGVQVRGSGTYASWTLIVRLGIWVEEQRPNLLKWSQDFAQSAWSKASCTVSSGSAVAPDGKSTADKLTPNVFETGSGYLMQSVPAAAGNAYSASVFVKKAEFDWAFLWLDNGSGVGVTLEVNLSTGENRLTRVNTSSYTAVKSAAMPVGDGWYRISISATTAFNAVQVRVFPAPFPYVSGGAYGTPNYQGDGVSGIYIWQADLQPGNSVTSPIPTEGAQATRAADVPVVNVLSPWFRQREGTWLIGFTPPVGVIFPRLISYSDIARSFLELGSGGRLGTWAGVGLVTPNIATYGAANKGAITYSSVGRSLSLNGGDVASDANHVDPAVNGIRLGANHGGAQYLSGHIEFIRFYPKALPDQLQALTA